MGQAKKQRKMQGTQAKAKDIQNSTEVQRTLSIGQRGRSSDHQTM